MVNIKKKKSIKLISKIVLTIAFITTIFAGILFNKQKEKYIDLVNEKHVSGVVKRSFSERASLYITLSQKSKYMIRHSYNFSYSPSFVGDFIQKGDSIVKHSGSDTLFVFRNNNTYYFIIGERINED